MSTSMMHHMSFAPKPKPFSLPRYFVIVCLLLIVVAAGLTMSMFRSYVTEVPVLAIPRDARAASLANQTVDTIAEFPLTLDFYDRLLKNNPDITDPWKGLSTEERRNAWLSHVETSRIKGSGVITMTVYGQSINQSRLLSQRILDALKGTVTDTYGADFDISLQTVDQPVSEARLSNPPMWGVASVSIGFLATVLVFGLIALVQQLVNRATTKPVGRPDDIGAKFKPGSWQPSTSESMYRPLNLPNRPRFTPGNMPTSLSVPPAPTTTPSPVVTPSVAQTESVPVPETTKPVEVPPVVMPVNRITPPTEMPSIPMPTPIVTPTPSAPVTIVTRPTASNAPGTPGNLPFADGEEFSWAAQLPGLAAKMTHDGTPVAAEVVQTTPAVVEAVTSPENAPETPTPTPARVEPTEEELKRRLNQLLRGGKI